MHAQQQILDAVMAALVGATSAGARVYLDRLDPLGAGELPALIVLEAPEGETVEPASVAGLERRELQVLVSCVVANSTSYAQQARQLGLEVEQILGQPRRPKPLTQCRIAASRLQLSGDAETLNASRDQWWRITYHTRRGQPDAIV